MKIKKTIVVFFGLFISITSFLLAAQVVPGCDESKMDYTQRKVQIINNSKMSFAIEFKGSGVTSNPTRIELAAGGKTDVYVKNNSMSDVGIAVDFTKVDGKNVSESGSQFVFRTTGRPDQVKAPVRVKETVSRYYIINTRILSQVDSRPEGYSYNPELPCWNDFIIWVDEIKGE